MNHAPNNAPLDPSAGGVIENSMPCPLVPGSYQDPLWFVANPFAGGVASTGDVDPSASTQSSAAAVKRVRLIEPDAPPLVSLLK